MSEQGQDAPRRPQPPVLSLVKQSHEAAVALLVERDGLKSKLAESEHQRQIENRRADLAEHENTQLREMLERMTVERDGYFRDASVLRSQFTTIGNAVATEVRAMMERQAFAPTPLAHTSPADDGAPLPRFLREGPRNFDAAPNGAPRRVVYGVDLDQLDAAIGGAR